MKTAAKPAPRQLGFTLIELMIVVAVISILTAIALPSYRQHVMKSRRAEGKAALLDLQTREERFFSVNNRYTATAADLGYATAYPVAVTTNGAASYLLTVTLGATTSQYSATAAPTGAQANDACGTYTITYLGQQSVSTARTDCW